MKRLLLVAFLCLGSFAQARTRASLADTVPPAVSQCAGSRIDSLETKSAAWQKIVARLPCFSGYVQTGYQYADNSSSFFLRRVRLSIAGDIVPKLDYRIQIEFCKPQLVDAYVQYRPFGQLNVKVGQYKVPFSIENTDYSPTRLEFTEYPLVLQRLMGLSDVCGLSATGRDLGAMIYGGFFARDGYSIVNYDLGLFNGEGINTRDKNKSKDFVARLTLKPVRGLAVSGSWYRGEYGASYLKRERYAAGACYDRGPVVVRGEWMGGITGMSDPVRNMKSDGWYLMAGWRVRPGLMPAARFERFTLDCDRRSATRQSNVTVGLSWTPVKYLLCQLDYTYEDYASGLGPDRNVVTLMFTGMF